MPLAGQHALRPDMQAALPGLMHTQPSSAFAEEPDTSQPPKTTAADKMINFRIRQSSMKNPGNYEFQYRRANRRLSLLQEF
jgi:hypothetical protein